ncbi:MAG TPA: hypothetical protein DD379_00295 [Cyanobacteria bacterium UBA11162]|nr:hypothetical protein [Cyanobacteria bacterium UBA11162]
MDLSPEKRETLGDKGDKGDKGEEFHNSFRLAIDPNNIPKVRKLSGNPPSPNLGKLGSVWNLKNTIAKRLSMVRYPKFKFSVYL